MRKSIAALAILGAFPLASPAQQAAIEGIPELFVPVAQR